MALSLLPSSLNCTGKPRGGGRAEPITLFMAYLTEAPRGVSEIFVLNDCSIHHILYGDLAESLRGEYERT